MGDAIGYYRYRQWYDQSHAVNFDTVRFGLWQFDLCVFNSVFRYVILFYADVPKKRFSFSYISFSHSNQSPAYNATSE